MLALLAFLALLQPSGLRTIRWPRALEDRDMVVMVLDDVSYYALEDAIESLPNFQEIAANGFVFKNCHAMPLCGPSRRTLLTSTWDISGQLAKICVPGDRMAIPHAVTTFPEFFPGHASGHFGKWHEGGHPDDDDWEMTPHVQGFDVARGWMSINVVNCGGTDYSTWKRVDDGVSQLVFNQYQPDVVFDEWSEWWGETESPKLAVFASQLAHEPFHRPPTSYLPSGYPPTSDSQARYQAMLVAIDTQLGEVLAEINLSETVLVVVGDNGTPTAVGGQKGTTLEGGTRVPLIFVGEGIPTGVSTSLVSIADVVPTLLGEAAGDGADLGEIMSGAVTKVHDYVLTGQAEDQVWPYDVACHGLRYVLRRTDLGEELYDLLTDPGQGTNLIGTPALAAKEAAMRSWLEAHLPP